MARKYPGAILILCVLIGACLVIPFNAAACFNWNVSCPDNQNNVDAGDYTIYEIHTSFSPGCRSTYWVSFTHTGVPMDWSAEILDESGIVIPTGVETVLSGTVSYIFSLKVTTHHSAMPGSSHSITTHVRANDYYNQDETVDIVTITTINPVESAPNPVILSMAGNTTYTIDLTWTQSDLLPGEFGRYEVHMSSDPNFTPVSGTWLASIADIGTTDFEVTGLSPETTYYFCIRVWDNDGKPGPFFADSNVLEARTRGFNDPPAPVHLFDPENVSNCEADLSWTENLDSDFAYYEIHVSDEIGFTPSAETKFGDPITDSTELAKRIDGLCENTTHYFKIRVYDSGGLYADSNEVNCLTLDYPPDQLLLDDPFDIDIDRMSLTWEQSCITDFDYYEVHISQTPGIIPDGSTLLMTIDKETNNTIEITGLDDETTYYFCIRHVDKAGNYMDSNEVFGTTLDNTVPRITFTNPEDGEIGVEITRAIVVTFSEPMDVGTISFFCSPDPQGWGISWGLGDSEVTYSHSVLQSKTTYTFEIISGQDLAGNFLVDGSEPNPWSFTTIDSVSPTILSITPVDGSNDVPLDGSVVITFSEPMDTESIMFTCNPDPEGWATSWNGDNTQLTLTHNDYSEVSTYLFEIIQGTDVSGNPLVTGGVENPTTFSTGDYTHPYIVITTPNNGDDDVLVTSTVSVVFSEEMNKQSVIEGLNCDFEYTAAWNGYTLVLTPKSELSKSSLYTVTIPATAKDKSGNQIGQDYSFGFTTEAPAPTNDAPVVNVYSPDQDTASDTFIILWSASDSDGDPLTLNIYYDTDTDSGNGKTLIIGDADNSGTYTWDINGLPEGQYYVYITASDGILEGGAYSGLLTITRSSGDGDSIDDNEKEGDSGATDIKDQGSVNSFPWLVLWIILAVVVILLLVGVMAYKNRNDRPQEIECQKCHTQFIPFNPNESSVECPNCGETTHL